MSFRCTWTHRLLGLFCLLAFVGAGESALAQGARKDEGEKVEPAKQPVLTSPPALLQAAVPVYPPKALADGKSAVVKVRIYIDAVGTVTKVDVIEPVGDGFDEAAISAAQQYLFKPAEFDGVAGAIVVETAINFTIQEEEVTVPDEGAGAAASTGKDAETELPDSHAGDRSKPVTVQGVALERGTRKKLVGIIVSVSGFDVDAITDDEGRFFFHGVSPGTHEIIAVDQAYDRFTKSLTVQANERLEVKLYMRRKGSNPYTTLVEGQREVLEVTRRRLERQQLTSVPGTFGDPIRVIQTLPGLARTPFSTGFLLIRGSNPDDSGVFFDGHRVPLLFHFLGGPSVLNPEFLEAIDLYPGGFPARFGRSQGGIVTIETRESKNDGVHGAGKIDFLDTSGYIRFPLGKNGAMSMAGRRSYVDNFIGFFLPEQDQGSSLLVVPVYFDYQARLDYDFKNNGKAFVFLIGSGDRLNVLSEDPEAESTFSLNTETDFFRVIGSYKRHLAKRLWLTLSPAYGRDSFNFGGSQSKAEGPATSFTADQNTFSYRMRVNGPVGDRYILDTGLDFEARATEYTLVAPVAVDVRDAGDGADAPNAELTLNADAVLYGWHIDLGADLGPLRLIPGFRVDGSLLNGENNWSFDPRFVARYKVHPAVTAKGYIGLFHQPPQPEQTDRFFGNPDVGIEQSLHTGLGAEWAFAPRWLLDGEAYYIDRTNQVRLSDQFSTDPQTGELIPENVANTGTGDTMGFEFLLKREVSKRLFGWISYTFSITKQRRTPADEEIFNTFDQRHTMNAVASYTFDRGWELGARFRLATGRPDTPVLGGTFDVDANQFEPVQGEQRSSRRKTFQQLDVRFEKTWTYESWALGVYLDIQNVLNASNEEAVQYDYRFREKSPIQSVPFLPVLGVRGKF